MMFFCPNCGNDEVLKKGIRRGKQKFLCKNLECPQPNFHIPLDDLPTKEEEEFFEEAKNEEFELVHWTDLSKLAKHHQEIRRKIRHFEVEAEAEVPANSVIMVIGDLHFGSEGADYFFLEEMTEYIKNNNVFIILVGDETDSFFTSFPNASSVFQQVLNPEEQQIFLKSWLEDVQDHLLCSTWGNHCLSEDTEILTLEGWKGIDNLKEEDSVLTMKMGNSESNLEFQKVEKKWTFPVGEYSEMIEIGGRVQGLVTPDHDMVRQSRWTTRPKFWEKKRAKDLGNGRDFFPVSGFLQKERSISISDNLLWLLGVILADGTFHSESSAIEIYQGEKKKGEIEDRLRREGISYRLTEMKKKEGNIYDGKLIKATMRHYRIYINSEFGKRLRDILHGKKEIPLDFMFLSDEQYKHFLAGLMYGDGTWHKGREGEVGFFYPGNKEMADRFQALAVTHGFSCLVRKNVRGYWVINLSRKIKRCVDNEQKSLVSYSGRVWCVTVPNGTIVTRRKGNTLVVGNSARFEKIIGFDLEGRVKAKFAPYFNGIGKLNLKVGEKLYRIIITHKGKGHSHLNPTHHIQRLAREIVDGDLFLGGHYHNPAISQVEIRGKMIPFIQTGTLVSGADTYGQRHFRFDGAKTIFPALFMTEEDICPFKNVVWATRFRDAIS